MHRATMLARRLSFGAVAAMAVLYASHPSSAQRDRAVRVAVGETGGAEGLEVRCEVSLVVADARGGAVRAMLRGRAGARGGTDAARLQGNALRAAVRGALRPLAQHGHALARGR